jgi:hypothetical protein
MIFMYEAKESRYGWLIAGHEAPEKQRLERAPSHGEGALAHIFNGPL